MSEFLKVLASIDTDAKAALAVAAKAAPIIALFPGGAEANAVVSALSALETKLASL